MFGRTRDSISRWCEDISPDDAVFLLWDIEETHGRDAIIAMYGFLRYMAHKIREMDEEKRERQITTTLIHDINERKNKLALLRTSEYYEFCNI